MLFFPSGFSFAEKSEIHPTITRALGAANLGSGFGDLEFGVRAEGFRL